MNPALPYPIENRRIPASVSEINPVWEAFEEALRKMKLSRDEVDAWKIIFYESLSNAIRHGCRSNSGHSVGIAWQVGRRSAMLEVSDPGSGPPEGLLSAELCAPDPLEETGRGMFLIQHFGGVCEHHTNETGYTLRVSRKTTTVSKKL